MSCKQSAQAHLHIRFGDGTHRACRSTIQAPRLVITLAVAAIGLAACANITSEAKYVKRDALLFEDTFGIVIDAQMCAPLVHQEKMDEQLKAPRFEVVELTGRTPGLSRAVGLTASGQPVYELRNILWPARIRALVSVESPGSQIHVYVPPRLLPLLEEDGWTAWSAAAYSAGADSKVSYRLIYDQAVQHVETSAGALRIRWRLNHYRETERIAGPHIAALPDC